MRPGGVCCASAGCDREATHFPKINVPAAGHPLGSHDPIGLVIALKLCRQHAEAFPALDQFAPGAPGAIRDVIEIMCRNRCPPDFERAFTTTVRLTSPEGLSMDKATSTAH